MQLVCKCNSSPQKSSPSLPNKIDRSFSLTSLFLLDVRGRTACVALIIIDTRLSQASPHSLCDILIVIAYTCLCACFFSTFMSSILPIIPDLNGICILLAVDTLTAPYGWFFFAFFPSTNIGHCNRRAVAADSPSSAVPCPKPSTDKTTLPVSARKLNPIRKRRKHHGHTVSPRSVLKKTVEGFDKRVAVF